MKHISREDCYTAAEVARIFGTCVQTVGYWRRSGKLPAVAFAPPGVATRTWLFPREQIDAIRPIVASST